MDNSDKTLKALEQIYTRLEKLDTIEKQVGTIEKQVGTIEKQIGTIHKDISDLKQGQAHISTAVEALAEGQKDIREQMATKADIMDLRSALTKKVKGNERRITDIEDKLEIPHPHKN